MNTSQYIRHCISADYSGLINRFPESIATSNLLNKIYHRLERHTDPETLAEIRNYVRDYYNTGKGDVLCTGSYGAVDYLGEEFTVRKFEDIQHCYTRAGGRSPAMQTMKFSVFPLMQAGY